MELYRKVVADPAANAKARWAAAAGPLPPLARAGLPALQALRPARARSLQLPSCLADGWLHWWLHSTDRLVLLPAPEPPEPAGAGAGGRRA